MAQLKYLKPNFVKTGSDVIFSGVYNSGSQRIFCCFVNRIHFQFAENILSVCHNGVNARETFAGNFFCGFAKCQQVKYFFFSAGQDLVLYIGKVFSSQ